MCGSHWWFQSRKNVLSSYEVIDAVAVIKEADPRAIINQISTENFYGRFHREPE